MQLVIENLTKTYPNGVRALNGVSLVIPQGLFGLLGPNGAGKSSLMRTIATLQEPDAGSVRFFGEVGAPIDVLRDKVPMRRRLGYLPQEFGFYPTLSAEATLDHFAALKGINSARDRRETVERLLQQVNLYEVRKKNVGGYSGGMRQRLGIAVALLGNPEVIIVDEPTAGLDPTERHRFLNLLSEVGEKTIVILSTHIAEDVRELCERMAIIARGQVVAQGSPEQVINAVRGRLWKRLVDKSELDEAQRRYQVVSTRLVAGKPALTIFSETPPGDGFTPVEADLEDAYFFHTAVHGVQVTEAAGVAPPPPPPGQGQGPMAPLPVNPYTAPGNPWATDQNPVPQAPSNPDRQGSPPSPPPSNPWATDQIPPTGQRGDGA